MKSTIITAAFFIFAFCLDIAVDQKDADHILAESLIGPAHRIDLSGTSAFHSEKQAVLYFSFQGMQGPVRGLMIVSNNQIKKITIIESREGINHVALKNRKFLDIFHQHSIDMPIEVDAISGATVSSQLLKEAINTRLKEWKDYLAKNPSSIK